MIQNSTLLQGWGISRDETRLQWRTWGFWVLSFLLFGVILSDFSYIAGSTIDLPLAAFHFADCAAMIGSMLVMVSFPFVLDRVRRVRVAPIEFSKPFQHLAYVLGKFFGCFLPAAIILVAGLVLHLGIFLSGGHVVSLAAALTTYAYAFLMVTLAPILFAASLTFFLSVVFSKPLVIVPL